jgi:enoyl-CoA hydratase/carnithine racemase
MTIGLVTYFTESEIALVGLNRPDTHNVLENGFIEAIRKTAARAEAETKVGVIYGHGDHFCAGLSLIEQTRRIPIDDDSTSRRWQTVFDTIQRSRIPWISALHGAVVGGGLEFAASTHLRVADRSAYFALSEGQRGFFGNGIRPVRIANLVSAAVLTDLIMTGRTLSADESQHLNLVHYVVEKGEALSKAKELAAKIATNNRWSNFTVVQALQHMQDTLDCKPGGTIH